MTATTIEQSKHLFELGLNPDSADMFWMDTNSVKPCLNLMDDGIFNHRNYLVRFPNTSLPAWSLSALLEVMPNNDYWEICLWQYKDQRWQCVFDDVEFSNGETKSFVADTPIDAAYKMVCWLLEQELIKKGGQDGRD